MGFVVGRLGLETGAAGEEGEAGVLAGEMWSALGNWVEPSEYATDLSFAQQLKFCPTT